jgi:hypothetical protein
MLYTESRIVKVFNEGTDDMSYHYEIQRRLLNLVWITVWCPHENEVMKFNNVMDAEAWYNKHIVKPKKEIVKYL